MYSCTPIQGRSVGESVDKVGKKLINLYKVDKKFVEKKRNRLCQFNNLIKYNTNMNFKNSVFFELFSYTYLVLKKKKN